MKPVIELSGEIEYGPVIGERVVILQNGEPIYYTSEVAVIYSRTEKEIEFETKNSVYKVTRERETVETK